MTWRERWTVTIASDVAQRDGIGWEFADTKGVDAWFVFREDGGPFPVFSSSRRPGDLPPGRDLEAMTREAVADLLKADGRPDPVGWITDNITAALLLASHDFTSWEGEEWALESGPDDEPLVWASSDDSRIPFDRLRGHCVDGEVVVVSNYQDDGAFGLKFIQSPPPPALPESDVGSLRARRHIEVVAGPVTAVEVVYDTTVQDAGCAGVLAEVLLHTRTSSALLIAAEA